MTATKWCNEEIHGGRCTRHATYEIPDSHNPEVGLSNGGPNMRYRYGSSGLRCTQHTPVDMRRKEWRLPIVKHTSKSELNSGFDEVIALNQEWLKKQAK